ncbi:LOW QUALITY PROTEIN: hypothetical protein HID58_074935, partial [Brassica napus]
ISADVRNCISLGWVRLIVLARLGFARSSFWGSDFYALFHSSRTAPQFADFVLSPFPSLFSHLLSSLLASLVALPFTMLITQGLDNVFVRLFMVSSLFFDLAVVGFYYPSL